MKRETRGRIPARVPANGIAPVSLFTLPRCPLFFESMSNRQTDAAIRGCRAPFAPGKATEGRSRVARGTRCTTGTTGAIHSCLLPFRTHNAPRKNGRARGKDVCGARTFPVSKEEEGSSRARAEPYHFGYLQI
ncbi:hypothetical protein PUN28_007432 [Cardiocondyla obscurior]|uniref:Uncharacterized protein n=1 Tax=Cardiocondyla obscurior TaxID=286306 RepID=A0AAW2G8B9_9HYME